MRRIVLGVLALIFVTVLAGAIAPAPAQAYAAQVTVYPTGEVARYVSKIEYDQVCALDAGARVYFTTLGKVMIASQSIASSVAYYMIHQPYWNSASDRSTTSLITELRYHIGRERACIEYYYAGLPGFEKQLFGR